MTALILGIGTLLRVGAAELSLSNAAEADLAGAQAALDRFLTLEVKPNKEAKEVREQFRQGHAFEECVDRLGARLNANIAAQAVGEENMPAKLVAIAWDRKQRPDLYREIDDAYITAQEHRRTHNDRRAVQAPLLQTQHATETYRLTWEFFLLRPRLPSCIALYDHRAAEALARLKSEKSLTTLVHQFRTYDKPTVTSLTRQRQELVLGAIAGFQNEKALEALIQCASVSEPSPDADSKTSERRIDASQWIYDRLTARDQPEFRDAWKAVLQRTAVKSETPNDKQQRLLSRLNETMAKQ